MTEPGDETIRLGDRYELGGLLGRGGMADVRVGQDLRLGRTVAVKQLRADLSADDTFQARFRREAQSSAALNHPSIVAVYDTGESVNEHGTHVPYIVMEYVEGQTLRDILRNGDTGRRILPERALSITADILSALDYSHRSGIVHRDIKPANVMLTPSGQVKVMDFGIARAISDTSSAMTQTAAVIGTAQYLSPEQARGETVDARSDIYSTGCLLYELLTGRPPFVGESPVSVAYQHVREDARPPSQLNPDVGQAIDNIVARSLAKRVEDRYQSAADMRKDIERVLAGHHIDTPTAATPVVPAATAVAPAVGATAVNPRVAPTEQTDDDERKGVAWAVIALVLAIIAAIAGVLWYTGAFDSTEEPVALVKVTDVAGAEQSAAERALLNEGFNIGSVEEVASADVEEGTVIETDPPAGTEVEPGSTVNLVVSSGPETKPVPNVIGMPFNDAKRDLESDEYQFKVTRKNIDSSQPRGTVVNTSPGSTTRIPVGSNITVYVSKGEEQVPGVIGSDIDQATKTLEDLGFKVAVNEDPNSSAPEGQVTEQTPGPGSRVPYGTTITLTYSTNTGPDPEEPDPDPNADGGDQPDPDANGGQQKPPKP
jgi:beta-lactam-binding protein with PASTA domain/tRNA A-37 threonylcarbamoyl transferase component Bud32